MEIQKVFFGEQGLTETSANYIANLAKEALKREEAEVDAISFVHEQVSTLDNPNRTDLSLGMEEEECKGIQQKLEHIMKVKSLIAWLREAIKEKKKLHADVDVKELGEFNKKWEEENKEEKVEIKMPLTEEEYMDNLPIPERCKIFSLQTQAATIGKVIHEDGAFSKARDGMMKAKKNPRVIERIGVNNIIRYYEPSMSSEVVDNVYFELQKKHREIQAELNGYLHKMEEAILNSTIEYNMKMHEELVRDSQRSKLRNNAWETHSKKLHKEIAELKIIIPNQLRDVYNEINGLV